MLRYVFTAALLCVALPSYAAEMINCRVVGISDGDTFSCLTEAKVRIGEIDTPEKKQPYGTRARLALSNLIFGKSVALTVQDRDATAAQSPESTLGARTLTRN